VTLADRWLGHLLDKLDVLGLSEHTLVIHLTDHGHLFGEHQLQGKPGGPLGNLYEPTIRIPLMIRHPQGLGAGRRIDGLAQHVDLLPTVLEFLGVPAPPGIEGRSLWPLIRGEAQRVREHAFSGRYPNALAPGQGRRAQAAAFDGAAGAAAPGAAAAAGVRPTRLVEALTVTTEEWALVCSPRGRPSELYDLRADRRQERNAIAEQPEVARDLHDALLRFLEEVGAAEGRIAPFRVDVTRSDAEPEPPALADSAPLYVFEDARGVSFAFTSESVARSLGAGIAGPGAAARPRETTAGDLRRANPRALVHTPTQYYWISDLM
jgi:arylsulfatase A-like enzyme